MLIDFCSHCGNNFVPSKQFRFFCTSLCWDSFINDKQKRDDWSARGASALTHVNRLSADRPAGGSCVSIKGCTLNG